MRNGSWARAAFVSGFVLAGAAAAPLAHAQTVLQASATLQPLTRADNQGYSSCGIRAVITTPVPGGVVLGADFSVNLETTPRPWSLIKVGHIKGRLPDYKSLKAQPLVAFALAKESDGKPIKLSETRPAETPNFLLARAGMDDALALFTALFMGERVQLSVTKKKGGVSTVFAFSGEMEKEDFISLQSCLKVVLTRIEQQLKEPTK